jgi:hypothetical protein
MNAAAILDAAFNTLVKEEGLVTPVIEGEWVEGEAEGWLMQLATGDYYLCWAADERGIYPVLRSY